MSKEERYTAGPNLADDYAAQSYCEGRGWCVSGPGDGLGPYGYAHVPAFQFATLEEAQTVARMMNIAFEKGIQEQKKRVREVLT